MSKLVQFDVGFTRPLVSEAKWFTRQESLNIEIVFCMRGLFQLNASFFRQVFRKRAEKHASLE
jgi:hypothetical protein